MQYTIVYWSSDERKELFKGQTRDAALVAALPVAGDLITIDGTKYSVAGRNITSDLMTTSIIRIDLEWQ